MKKPPLNSKEQMSLSFERPRNSQPLECANVLAFPAKSQTPGVTTQKAESAALAKVLSHAQTLKRQL
jgi:hypothetical protein